MSKPKHKEAQKALEDELAKLQTAVARGNKAAIAKAIENLGAAPKSLHPDGLAVRQLAEIGAMLAKKGYVETFELLSKGGWTPALIPADRYADPIGDWIKAGVDTQFMDSLRKAGGSLFGRPKADEASSSGSLRSCVEMDDPVWASYFLQAMDAEKLSQKRRMSERHGFAEYALRKTRSKVREMLIESIKSNPSEWMDARAGNGRILAQTLLDSGAWDAFDAMVGVDAKKVAEGCCAERLVFGKKPLVAIKRLEACSIKAGIKFELDFGSLHSAVLIDSNSQELAAYLIGKGADPKAVNNKGTTPIGNALAKWSWKQLSEILGASPDDLCSSFAESSSAGRGRSSSLVEAMGQLCFAKDGELADARMARIIEQARMSKKFAGLQIEKAGFMDAVSAGHPECMKVWARAAAAAGLKIGADWFAPAISANPMGEACERGRLACISGARDLGVDVNESYTVTHYGAQKDTTLLRVAVLAAIQYGAYSDSAYQKVAIAKALKLGELGADPIKAKNIKGIDWDESDWDAKSKEMWGGLLALHEAVELGDLVKKAKGAGVPKKASL